MAKVYYNLVIHANHPTKDIWLADDEDNLVQQENGILKTELLPGNYVVHFGLKGKKIPFILDRDKVLYEASLT